MAKLNGILLEIKEKFQLSGMPEEQHKPPKVVLRRFVRIFNEVEDSRKDGIEVYGTGIRKIMGAYENRKEKPVIQHTSNAFKIILPNVNSKSAFTENDPSDDNESKAYELAKGAGVITRSDVEKQCNISASTASRLLRRMTEKGLLLQQGKGRNTRYSVPKV